MGGIGYHASVPLTMRRSRHRRPVQGVRRGSQSRVRRSAKILFITGR